MTIPAERRHWMSVLARASAAELERRLADCPPLPQHVRLRGPETGLVMTRGRAGGGGAPFNFAEMTVTRCTVRTPGGQLAHAYIAGRDARRAELSACVDAGMQDPALADALRRGVIEPLATAQAAARQANLRRAAATQVKFFTMATMRSDDRAPA